MLDQGLEAPLDPVDMCYRRFHQGQINPFVGIDTDFADAFRNELLDVVFISHGKSPPPDGMIEPLLMQINDMHAGQQILNGDFANHRLFARLGRTFGFADFLGITCFMLGTLGL